MNNITTTVSGVENAPAGLGLWPAVKRLGAFARWLLTGFGLLGYLRGSRQSRGRADHVVVYSVHRSFFLWPIILVGFVGSALVGRYPDTAEVWGWVYVWVLLYTLLTLLFDVGTLRFLLWSGILVFVWVVASYLEQMKHVPVLSGITGYLVGLHPSLDGGFASVVSWLLLGPWLGALFYTFSHGRKAFSPNSVEESFLGEGREIIDRAGLKFRSRYRDLFETVAGLGAGDLEAVRGNGQVTKRWENVLFLAFIWPRLDRILHQRASLVVDDAADDDAAAEPAHG